MQVRQFHGRSEQFSGILSFTVLEKPLLRKIMPTGGYMSVFYMIGQREENERFDSIAAP